MAPPRNSFSYQKVSQIALGVFVVALLTATHLPQGSSVLPPEEHNLDKAYHFAAYGVLALLVATTWELSTGVLTVRHLRWVWFAVVIFGALDEITQLLVGRDCSIWDWSADALGTAVGLIAFAWFRKLVSRRGQP